MGIVGSDFVAVTCIVVGGVLGGLGWNALGVTEAGPEALPPAPDCSGIAITAVSTPDVIVRIGDGQKIVLTSRAPEASNVQVVCGDVTATADELQARARRARVRVINLRRELQSTQVPEIRFYRFPEPTR